MRVIINFLNSKRVLYLQIVEELKTIIFIFIIRRVFRKVDF